MLPCNLVRAACALLVLLALSAPRVGEAQGQDDPGRAMFEAGRDAYDRGRFDVALDLFERSYALSKRPKLLYNIGRAAEGDLKHERAIEAYEGYLAADASGDNRDFVEARLAKLRALTGRAPAPRATPAPDKRATGRREPPLAAGPATPAGQPYTTPPAYAASAAAAPRTGIPRFRLYAGLHLGTAVEAEVTSVVNDATYSFDMATSVGVQAGVGFAWRYFGIGAELQVSRLAPDDDAQGLPKFAAIELLAKPRGGYQFSHIPLELYGTVPLGVVVPTGDMLSTGGSFGVLVGASWFFSRRVGLNFELGWRLHVYGTDDSIYNVSSFDISQWTPFTVNLMIGL